MNPPKPPQNPPPPNHPPGNQPPPGKGDGKGTNYSGYSTYGDYGTYGYGAGTGYGGYGYGSPGYGQYGGYNGYYYGYGYGYGGNQQGGEPTQTRNIRDYLVILRERIWYLVLTFFVIFSAFILFWYNSTPIYTATASLEVLRAATGASQLVAGTPNAADNTLDSTEFNTRIRLMEAHEIADRVADMMTADEKRQFLAPFESKNPLIQDASIQDLLLRQRKVEPGRLAYIMQVEVEHPDRLIAAKVANYFVTAFIEYTQEMDVKKAAASVDVLREGSRQQQKAIEDKTQEMNDLVSKYGKENLDPATDTLPTQLASWNTQLQSDQSTRDAAETKWKQVQDVEDQKKNLWDIGTIAGDTHVSALLSDLNAKQINLAGMQKKYGPNHPDIKQLVQEITSEQTELNDAVQSAAAKIKTDYLAAEDKYNKTEAQVELIKQQMKDLEVVQSKYMSLLGQKTTAEAMERDMEENISHQEQLALGNTDKYLPVDDAKGMTVQTWPKPALLIFGGIITGLMGGVGMAFLVAFLDDRIKSAFDIESYVGLPLIGILPRIAHLNANEKAQAVASNADRRITEAFRSIYSSLKLNDASKNARVILVTSTVPSEGKSFLTTNLALTYAMHAERVLLVDCDLRMPNVAKSLGRDTNERGLMPHLREGRPFEECVHKDFYPGLDVLPTGGRTNNPTQIFNSREFADFITRMRQQYDRVFIDSPPLGAVSDALNLLPNVDGVLYVIKFNTVKRKVAKINLSRLMQGNVPVFGAILNQISLASASYYYTHYYDKSYRNYYMRDEDHAPEDGEQPAAAPGQEPPAKS